LFGDDDADAGDCHIKNEGSQLGNDPGETASMTDQTVPDTHDWKEHICIDVSKQCDSNVAYDDDAEKLRKTNEGSHFGNDPNMPNSVREKWLKIEPILARSYYLNPPSDN